MMPDVQEANFAYSIAMDPLTGDPLMVNGVWCDLHFSTPTLKLFEAPRQGRFAMRRKERGDVWEVLLITDERLYLKMLLTTKDLGSNEL